MRFLSIRGKFKDLQCIFWVQKTARDTRLTFTLRLSGTEKFIFKEHSAALFLVLFGFSLIILRGGNDRKHKVSKRDKSGKLNK
jgi:hypothetical protein